MAIGRLCYSIGGLKTWLNSIGVRDRKLINGKYLLIGTALINDNFDKSLFVRHPNIKSICRRMEVANDVIISGMDDTGAKTYYSILGFVGLALTVFSQCSSLTDGRQVNFHGTGRSLWRHFRCWREWLQDQSVGQISWLQFLPFWRNARFYRRREGHRSRNNRWNPTVSSRKRNEITYLPRNASNWLF